jgi:NAD(P)-dependent dehydrogenase (short-subunit alcohol dehydrogenase family)
VDINLNGKNVVITGAARGIGREICAGFALAGANVIAVDMRDMAETQAFVRGKQPQAKLDLYTVDLADPASVEHGCRAILAKHPSIDVLVNDGAIWGGLKITPLDKINLEEWDRVLAVNVRGTYLMIRGLLPGLRAARASIINMASSAPLRGSPFCLHYATSKGAIIGMTRSLANELGNEGLRVNAIAPGLVDNEASRGFGGDKFGGMLQSTVAAQCLHTPLVEEEVVGTVLYLASSLASPITGALLTIDKGLIKY